MTERSKGGRRGPAHAPPTAASALTTPLLGYRPSLDGLRAVAVLAVMSWHYVLPGVKGGFLGVDIFFVLSGFLITRLLVEEWELSSRIHLGRFYLRRMLRLFPALFLVLLVTLPIVPRIWTGYALLYVTNWGSSPESSTRARSCSCGRCRWRSSSTSSGRRSCSGSWRSRSRGASSARSS